MKAVPVHVGAILPLNAARVGEEIPDIRRVARHSEEVGLDGVWAEDQPSEDANARIINYLVGAYGMHPERATALAVGGSPPRSPSGSRRMRRRELAPSWSFPSATRVLTQYDLIAETRSMSRT